MVNVYSIGLVEHHLLHCSLLSNYSLYIIFAIVFFLSTFLSKFRLQSYNNKYIKYVNLILPVSCTWTYEQYWINMSLLVIVLIVEISFSLNKDATKSFSHPGKLVQTLYFNLREHDTSSVCIIMFNVTASWRLRFITWFGDHNNLSSNYYVV